MSYNESRHANKLVLPFPGSASTSSLYFSQPRSCQNAQSRQFMQRKWPACGGSISEDREGSADCSSVHSHDRLAIAGNCRMCLVEVSPGPPKPQVCRNSYRKPCPLANALNHLVAICIGFLVSHTSLFRLSASLGFDLRSHPGFPSQRHARNARSEGQNEQPSRS